MPPAYEQTIATISERLKTLNPYRVVLFGSHAWGSPGPDSDIDLLVVLNKEERSAGFREKMDDTAAVKMLLADINRQVALDIIVCSKQEWQRFLESGSSFSREVAAKGITLQ